MADTNDLSPWVHPKAQSWFHALFRKSGLAMALEDELRKPEEQLTPAVMRMIVAIAVLMGRPEIWPENERDVLMKIMQRAREYSQKPPKSPTGGALTLREHQDHTRTNDELVREVELLRRQIGASVKKTKIGTPKSWEPFWE